MKKDVFYYDLSRYILDIMVEQQLEEEGLSDATGLGKGGSPLESVYEPCVRDSDEGDWEGEGFVEVNGKVVCEESEDYLFWDSFNLGCVAKEGIVKEVAELVLQGKKL